MSPNLSIVIPAYNEATRLSETIQTALAYLNEYQPEAELIVVDDGSTDETALVAERSLANPGSIQGRVIRNQPNRGKGHAVRTGLLAARADIALFSDADFSTPITETPKLVEPIERGDCDLDFGSRALDRSLIGVHQPWRREQGGRVFNLIVKVVTGIPFWDTQCGFKAFRMSVCRPIIEAAKIDRFAFDVELIYVAHLARLRLCEIPVRWDNYEGSKINFVRDSFNMVGEVLSIRDRARRGEYDAALTATRELAGNHSLATERFATEEN